MDYETKIQVFIVSHSVYSILQLYTQETFIDSLVSIDTLVYTFTHTDSLNRHVSIVYILQNTLVNGCDATSKLKKLFLTRVRSCWLT